MKKRFLGILLAGVMACGLSACGKTADADVNNEDEITVEDTDESPEEESKEESDVEADQTKEISDEEAVAEDTVVSEDEGISAETEESVRYYDGYYVSGFEAGVEKIGRDILSLFCYNNDEIWVDFFSFLSADVGKPTADSDSRGFTCELPWEDRLDWEGEGDPVKLFAESNYYAVSTYNSDFAVFYFPDEVDNEGRTPEESLKQFLLDYDLWTNYIVSENNKFGVIYYDRLEDAQRILDSCKEYSSYDITEAWNEMLSRVNE